jgi:hypothetical protein
MTKATATDYQRAADRIGCDIATIRAVAKVESNETGQKNGTLIRRFEPHIFSRRTGATANSYSAAYRLNPREAMMSTSWGMFQIMGFNHVAAGFPTVESMVAAYEKSESTQIESFATLITDRSWQLADELRERRWADFARRYNGPAFAQNKYDTKLATFYAQLSKEPLILEKKKKTQRSSVGSL